MALTPAKSNARRSRPWTDDRPDLPSAPATAVTPCEPIAKYVMQDGLRRVEPYFWTYNTYCKQRWRGREILDIFATEFRDRTAEYYHDAIESGRITLDGKPVNVHTVVQNGQVISHTLHRHEPPVTALPIRTVFEDGEMLVIDKPAGVPVHPTGRYRFNSVVEIIRAERGFVFNPLPVNRLDRLTSGVMFIGKTGKKAEEVSAQLRGRTVRKEYVARVKGRFPDGQEWDGDPMRGGVVKCDEPILQISPILGLNRARASGKMAKTLFRRIAYYPPTKERTEASNTDTKDTQNTPDPIPTDSRESDAEQEGYSIVHCLPLTGRTHQIRVHLQFLGHPISNDPIYSNRRVFGANLGKSDNSGNNDAEVMEKLSQMGKTDLASAASYSDDEKSARKKKIKPAQNPSIAGISTLVDQTQQITLSDAIKAEVEQQQPPSSPVSDLSHNHERKFKPLPGSLHAGPLPHSTLSQLESLTQSQPPGSDPANTTEISPDDPTYAAFVTAHNEEVKQYNKRRGEKLSGQHCLICQTPLYTDPGPHELGIYLHALAYADLHGAWRYTSKMPTWARPPPSSTPVDGDPEEVDTQEWEWDYSGAGGEGLDIGDERANERERTEAGMWKNRELQDDPPHP